MQKKTCTFSHRGVREQQTDFYVHQLLGLCQTCGVETDSRVPLSDPLCRGNHFGAEKRDLMRITLVPVQYDPQSQLSHYEKQG